MKTMLANKSGNKWEERLDKLTIEDIGFEDLGWDTQERVRNFIRNLLASYRHQLAKQVEGLKKSNLSRTHYASSEPFPNFLKKRHKKEGYNTALKDCLSLIRRGE